MDTSYYTHTLGYHVVLVRLVLMQLIIPQVLVRFWHAVLYNKQSTNLTGLQQMVISYTGHMSANIDMPAGLCAMLQAQFSQL